MDTGVDLYWLPLGAGGHSVRFNGRVYEAVVSWREHRRPCDLYHSALMVHTSQNSFAIEMTPVQKGRGSLRGVVAEGAVGTRWAGLFRIFRYEVRRWPGGAIPDISEAVDSPRRLTSDPLLARRALDLVPLVPTPVWGRDELRVGDMWNSNSLISWLLAGCDLITAATLPPRGGRAPGWTAGLASARAWGATDLPHGVSRQHTPLIARARRTRHRTTRSG